MKKIFSLLLAVLMLVSALPVAYAAETNDYTAGTAVVYTADNSTDYSITVPATLAPGASGIVTLSGSWASNQTVKVTADKTVTLTNSINANDQKTLDVTFAGMEKVGDNTQARTYTEAVSVAAMPSDALFGTWDGKFNYNVELVEDTTGGEESNLITFTIDGTEYQAEPNMTWQAWVDSDYNTVGATIEGDSIYVNGNAIQKDGYEESRRYTIAADGAYTIETGAEPEVEMATVAITVDGNGSKAWLEINGSEYYEEQTLELPVGTVIECTVSTSVMSMGGDRTSYIILNGEEVYAGTGTTYMYTVTRNCTIRLEDHQSSGDSWGYIYITEG